MHDKDPNDLERRPRHDDVVPFTASDGVRCNLVHVRGNVPPTKGPVLLVHGAGVRAEIFRPPTKVTLVDYLIEQGYDVWMENWRASIDLPAHAWTLDQAAAFDHPEAVRTVVRETGADRIKAVVHCQGSCSFVMSAVAGLLPQVETVVSNACSLHPIVPPWSWVKLQLLLPVVARLTDHLDPRWGLGAPTLSAKLITRFGAITQGGCDNAVCTQVSFTYGSGAPALWRHENLDDTTHAWLADEFGFVPMSFFRQMAQCVTRGHVVRVEALSVLPEDFVASAPLTDARFVLLAGDKNGTFLPASQVATFDHFNRFRKNHHALYVLPGYSHLDVLWGKDAARDIFPLIGAELDKPARSPRASPSRPARAAYEASPPPAGRVSEG